ncbi:Protein N-acetyltransferase, RimJ/RimL family [Microbacterium sp. cf046]|uniref:GNAT family N-acetyltransferase n=1 Tax=Microbacterium sp. cf046 TaxID=1761803 RepID=UPI0008ECAAAE|nr:GNAT family N-acetyltransferase [Microbacterium sp. cf046]SFR86669.1 Protein N-acetyltransferase, RimJ/RimL family [Microbacterium sp. cf046]
MALPWDFRPLTGSRVGLELLRPDDFDALYAIQSDPEVCRYLLYEPRSPERVHEVLERDAAATRLATGEDFVQPAIRDATGRLIGTMYFKLASVEDRTAEIGWLLDPRFQGQGYAREAAAVLLDLAFGELGLHRVYAELDPRNTASVALCLRLGMREEAFLRENMWFKGDWADTGIYAILEHEWRRRPQTP